jgi:hypothetical protein
VTMRRLRMFVRLLKRRWISMIQQRSIPRTGWLAFLLCSHHPIDYFTGRRLSLQSCVPPPLGQPDNVEVLPPSANLQNLERNSGGSSRVSKGPKKRTVAGSSEGNSAVSNSSFTHTVQLVSNRKDDEELAHIKEQVATIKDAISTLEDLDTVGYAEELINLRKELAVAVLHQVKMMKQRTEEYKHSRAAEVAADNFAKQLDTTATHSVLPRSTPLSALGSPDVDATQYHLPTPGMIVEEEPEHWIQFENPSQFDKLM